MCIIKLDLIKFILTSGDETSYFPFPRVNIYDTLLYNVFAFPIFFQTLKCKNITMHELAYYILIMDILLNIKWRICFVNKLLVREEILEGIYLDKQFVILDKMGLHFISTYAVNWKCIAML